MLRLNGEENGIGVPDAESSKLSVAFESMPHTELVSVAYAQNANDKVKDKPFG